MTIKVVPCQTGAGLGCDQSSALSKAVGTVSSPSPQPSPLGEGGSRSSLTDTFALAAAGIKLCLGSVCRDSSIVKRYSLQTCVICLLLLRGSVFAATATGQHGIVATVQPVATDAALSALKGGGNAIDAAVAAALTLGVVDGHNSGIGGGCFMLIRLASGEVVAIDGRETAPAKATRDMFVRNGKAETGLTQTGPLAAGVPGALAAYDYALKHYGKRP